MNGALPPSSSETFFTLLRALRHQQLPDLGRAGEAELAHERVATVISPPIVGASSASPVTTLSTPGGSPASSAELRDRERGERRLLGRLQHHRAAGRERGRGLARRHRRGEVPRRDPGA